MGDHQFKTDSPSIAEVALVGVKTIVRNADVVLDLQSAVYMFKLARSLVKYVDETKAYGKYVGKIHHAFAKSSMFYVIGEALL